MGLLDLVVRLTSMNVRATHAPIKALAWMNVEPSGVSVCQVTLGSAVSKMLMNVPQNHVTTMAYVVILSTNTGAVVHKALLVTNVI